MVAYSFKARFAEPILAGTKGGTIRLPRKPGRAHIEIVLDEGQLYARERPGGHARPGEELQLYTGMRTKHCRLIARKTCLAVEPIKLDFSDERIYLADGCIMFGLLEDFARFDGFANWYELLAFWHKTHGCDLIYRGGFRGWHIRWLPLPWEAAGA